MDVIYQPAGAVINWFVYHGANKQTEDFSLLAPESVKAIIIGPSNRHCCHMDHDDVVVTGNEYEALMTAERDAETGENYLRIEIEDGVLEEGIYDLKLYWIKNRVAYDPHVGNYPRCETYVKGAFSVISPSSSQYATEDFEKTIRSNVEYKPYDGLSAYEIAVLHGYYMSEGTWVEKYRDAEDRVDDLLDDSIEGSWAQRFEAWSTAFTSMEDTFEDGWAPLFSASNEDGWAWQFSDADGSWKKLVASWAEAEAERAEAEDDRENFFETVEDEYTNTWAPKFVVTNVNGWAKHFNPDNTTSWAWKFDASKEGSWADNMSAWEDKFKPYVTGSWANLFAGWAVNFDIDTLDSWAYKFAGWESKLDDNGTWDVHFQADTEGSWAWQFTDSEGTGTNPDSWMKQFDDAITASSSATSSANTAAAAADAAREAIEEDLAAKADTADLLDGSLVPAVAANLKSWAERGEHEVVDEWIDPVRTTGGSLSIDSSKDAYILYLRSDGAFKADGIYASGENLLNPAESVGSAYVILVPKMLRGAYGTADEANGIVFCDNAGNNLHPTVRFSETYPTSATDGTAVTPYQFSGHSEYFYPSSKHGYFIVTLPSGKTAANTCARIAWSKDYNKFVAYTSPSFVSFASAIAAIAQTHSGVTDKMLAVGNVSDDIVFTTSAAAWTRRCSAYTPTWTSEATEDGQYLHTASIPDTNGAMKAGGAAASLDGSMEFETAGNVVSFVDSNASCSLTVKYELATVVTGSVTQSNSYAPNDLGIEYLDDVDGEFVIRTSYYQGIPDSVYSMLSRLEELEADFYALAAQQDELGDIHAKSIDTDELPKVCHYEMICIGSGAPTFIPDFIGQRYIDMTNKKSYDACGVSAASDWKANN